MAVFTILLGGDVFVTPRLKQQVSGSIVLAADGGMRHAKPLDLKPDLWLGDFDSSDEELKQLYSGIERAVFPVAKDMTDGELAVDAALARGAKRIILCGAFGGERTDHALFHMTFAVNLAKRGINVMLASGREEAYPVLPGAFQYDLPDRSLFSIIGLSDLDGLCIEDAEWPLADKHVPFGASLTLSNRIRGTLNVKLRSGQAILLATLTQAL
ncbi:thiamine diphosphokinase [Bartonella sp. LJL80]